VALGLASIKAPAVIEQFITVSCERVPIGMIKLVIIEYSDLHDPLFYQLVD
jgi:hypothetical protein